MSGNDGSGNIEERDDWETPQWLFDILNKQYNFTFDCCARFENSKTLGHSSDFLKMDWRTLITDSLWINPPFSKAKKMIEHFFKVVEKGVGIYRIDNIESKLWYFIIKKADWIFIPTGRIAYEHNERKQQSPRFGSALFGIGVEPPKDLKGVTLFNEDKDK